MGCRTEVGSGCYHTVCARALDDDSRNSGTSVSPPWKIDMFESWSHEVSELEEIARVT